MPRPGDLAKRTLRWLTERSPATILAAGWIVFFLGSYPGYLSIDSVLQLYTVRTGDTTDYAPLMTVLWQVFEYVLAGPFPMLVLQSGLFLVGAYAVLGRLLRPRAAAVAAVLVLVFPPVFATMAVIWPSSLMAGALLAGTGAILTGNRRWQIAGGACFVLACSCRPEVAFALIPLALLVVPKAIWWKRAGLALALVIGVAAIGRGADYAFTVVDNYDWAQRLMPADLVGTLRRAKVKDEATIDAALGAVPRAAELPVVTRRIADKKDALDSFPIIHGTEPILKEPMNDDDAAALARSWRKVIASYPGAYLIHRWAMTRAIIGLGRSFEPIYDHFGDNELLGPLHHRATPSDWQVGWKAIVRACRPIFRPVIYLALALAVLVVARRRLGDLRALVASGLVYFATIAFLAPAVDYRYAHWLVAVTALAIAAVVAIRLGHRRDEVEDGG